jgi:hypothetical protein
MDEDNGDYEDGYADGQKQAEWEINSNALERAWGHTERQSGRSAAYNAGYDQGLEDGRR